MWYKTLWHRFMVYQEPEAQRINVQQAEEFFHQLSPVVRRGLRKLYPYIDPPSAVEEKGFHAPPEMYFDNSLAAARLRSLALYQVDRLWQARRQGAKIIGLAQDAGQLLPFLITGENLAWFSFDTLGALYASTSRQRSIFQAAEQIGIRRESCPVIKACIGLLRLGEIPEPDLVIAQTGASCDDHAVQMQLKEWLGYKIHWLEIPYRRSWQAYFSSFEAYPKHHEYYQKDAMVFYREQLRNLQNRLGEMYGFTLTTERLKDAMLTVNRFRRIIRRLTHRIAAAQQCPLPAVDQLLLHVCAMDGYGDLSETQDILEHMEQLITCRERKVSGVLPGETRRTPHILWMMPVLEMNLPSILEDAGARVVGWEMPHLSAHDYEIDNDPLSAMATDYLRFPLLGDCQLRLKWLADYISRYRVDGVIYSSIWSCTQMPIQAGIVKDFLSNYNIPILILDCGRPGGMVSGQMRTRIEAFVENLSKPSGY